MIVFVFVDLLVIALLAASTVLVSVNSTRPSRRRLGFKGIKGNLKFLNYGWLSFLLLGDTIFLPLLSNFTLPCSVSVKSKPSFTILKFTFKRWWLETYVDMLNVVRGENPEALHYNYDYTESAPIRGLPFIVSPGIRAEFSL